MTLAGGALATPALVLAVVFGAAQTRPGKAWLAQELGALLSDPAERVTIDRITGLVPFDVTIGRIEVTDRQGPRVVIDDAVLEIEPVQLLAARLTGQVMARRIAIERPPEQRTSFDYGVFLRMPVDVRIERLQLARVELGKAMLGHPLAATVTASGELTRGHAAASLDLHAIDGSSGTIKVNAAYDAQRSRLDLDANVDEPEGEVLAGLLDRSEKIPLTLHLVGHGALDDWHGRLSATTGNGAALDAALDIARTSAYRITTQGSAQLASLLPSRLIPLIGDHAQFSATIDINAAAIALGSCDVEVAAGRIAAQGRLDRISSAVAATATLKLSDIAALGPLLAAQTGGALSASVELAGTLAAPTVHVSVSADGLSVDRTRIAHTEAAFDARLAGGGADPASQIAVDARGVIGGAETTEFPLPRAVGDHIDWHLAGDFDRRSSRFAVQSLSISTGSAAVALKGEVGPAGASGHVHLDGANIADFVDLFNGGRLALDADVEATSDGAANAVLSGALHDPATGAPALDATLGSDVKFAGTVRRLGDGSVSLSNAKLEGAGAAIAGSALRSSDGKIATDFSVALPRLATLDARIAGRATIAGHLEGLPPKLSGSAVLTADALTAGPVRIERVEAKITIADTGKPAGRLDAKFRSAGLGGSVTADAALAPGGM
ncbi:MAG TPA: hypothetical protein VET85_15600, partial [Stellaceae bacterium]|nr:hypothetical protein [Stellaceae bacterium]